jgi:hypothetical protein
MEGFRQRDEKLKHPHSTSSVINNHDQVGKAGR